MKIATSKNHEPKTAPQNQLCKSKELIEAPWLDTLLKLRWSTAVPPGVQAGGGTPKVALRALWFLPLIPPAMCCC